MVLLNPDPRVKGMEMSEAVSATIEKQLNEIDMNFQKLIDLVNAYMKKTSLLKTRNS